MPELSDGTTTWASVPEVIQTLPGLYSAVVPMKENLELLCGQRGPVAQYSVSQQVLDIKASAGVLASEVIQLNYATINTTNPESLASQLTIVRATADSATASGQVELKAVANPISGVVASYQWTLTAGDRSTGMTAFQKGDGSGGIGFTASQFGLVDSGTLLPVFNYSSGVFTFNAPVVIDTANIRDLAVTNFKVATAAVSNPKLENNAATQSTAARSSGTEATVVLNLRNTGQVVVWGSWDGQGGGFVPSSTVIGDLVLMADGDLWYAVLNNYFVFVSGGSTSYSFLQTSIMGVFNLSPGIHSFTVQDTNGSGAGGVSITAMELSK